MVELAAYAGPRWSELIALTESSVNTAERKVEIRWRVAQPTGKPRRLAPPKMAKQRITIYPEVSPTGYPLGQMMRRRRVALEEWKLPDSTVSLLAGHSDPNFTRTRYVGAAEDALDAAVAATSAAAIPPVTAQSFVSEADVK